MWQLVLIGTVIYLIAQNKQAADTLTAFPKMEGGKNLAFDKLPLNEFGLPITIHVYKIDFPLVVGDTGNVIAVLQQMLNARNYGFQIPVTGIFDEQTRAAIFDASVSMDDFKLMALSEKPIVADVKIYDYKPGAG